MGLISANTGTPGTKTVVITPNDDNDLVDAVKSLWINTDGIIVATALYDDQPQTYTVAAGTPLPMVFKRIYTASTATFVAIVS